MRSIRVWYLYVRWSKLDVDLIQLTIEYRKGSWLARETEIDFLFQGIFLLGKKNRGRRNPRGQV
jgi:hypothetical protein